MTKRWMIYGATGYTGKLIARAAKAQSLKPTLAGRSADKMQKLASELELPWAAFSVDDTHAVEAAITDYQAVLSVAGPFSATANQLMNACIKTKTHYLDVTGEIAVFELAASLSGAAEKAGITLIPGVGFDVVPSDCLAAHTAKRAKAPVSLALAIKAIGNPSHGTAKTAIESLGNGTLVRENGKLVTKAAGTVKRRFTLSGDEEEYLAVSWGDVSTAYYSTGIDNVSVYFPNIGPIKSMTKLSRFIGPVLKLSGVQSFLKKQIDKMPAGPTEADRKRDTSILLAEAEDQDGNVFISTLKTPNGYSLTADSALVCVSKLLSEDIKPGFQTPSMAFGADFLNELKDCEIKDL